MHGYARFERDLKNIQETSRTLPRHFEFPRSLGDVREDLLDLTGSYWDVSVLR